MYLCIHLGIKNSKGMLLTGHGPYMRSIDDIPSMSCSLTVVCRLFGVGAMMVFYKAPSLDTIVPSTVSIRILQRLGV